MPDSGEVYVGAQHLYVRGELDWVDASADIRVALLKSTGPPTFVAAHATLKEVLDHANNTECNDASYARVTVAAAGRNENTAGRVVQGRFNAAVDFGALTGETVGVALVYLHRTDVTDPGDASVPLALTIYDPVKVTNGAGFTVGGVNAVVLELTGVTNP